MGVSGFAHWMAVLVICISAVSAFEGSPGHRSGSVTAPMNWTSHRGGPEQDGVSSGSLPDTLHLSWSFSASGSIESSVVVKDGSAYVGSAAGQVHSVDLVTGVPRWTVEVGAPVSASPLILGDALYVGDEDGIFHCLGLEDGHLRWKVETDGKILGAANWAQRDSLPVIVFGSYDGKLRCVDAVAGTLQWEYGTENFIHGTPSVSDGKVVFGGCDAWLHALSIDDGRSLGKCHVEGQVGASAAVVAGTAFFGTYEGVMLSVDLKSMKIGWTYQDRALPYISSPAVTDTRIVVGSRDRRIDCIDRKTGERIWVARTRGRVDGSPVVVGDRVLIGCADGRLYMLRLEDGSEAWSYDLGAAIRTTPAISAGRVLVGGSDGRLHCFQGTP